MRRRMSFLGTFFGCAALWAGQAMGEVSVTTTVPGTSQPWSFASGGLNSSDQYGLNDGTGPVVVGSGDGFVFSAGDVLDLQYQSGTVSAGVDFSLPYTDAIGDTAIPVNNNTDSGNGKYYPSRYFNSDQYPANLGELVGTFTNSSGSIVGTPFNVGDSASLTIPAGASQLQLGINDDHFADNTGSYSVKISENVPVITPPAVPLPPAVWPGLTGLGGIIASQYIRSRHRTVNA